MLGTRTMEISVGVFAAKHSPTCDAIVNLSHDSQRALGAELLHETVKEVHRELMSVHVCYQRRQGFQCPITGMASVGVLGW